MITTILDLISGPSPLSEDPPVVEPMKWVSRFPEAFWYGITITFSPTWYPQPKKGKRRNKYLNKYSPLQQYSQTKSVIVNDFKGMIYLLYPEWNDAGIVHYHGVIAHPTINIENSLVLTSIKLIVKGYGDRNVHRDALQKVSNIKKCLTYASKEKNASLSSGRP